MNPQTTPTPQNNSTSHNEQILVVKREHLFTHGAWHGLQQKHFNKYLHIAHDKREFIPRSHAETDPTYKQIIPYLVFEHAERYFLMQRRHDSSEKRLQNRWTLGIGGHVRQEDITSSHIFDWAHREFHEEVAYRGSLTIEPLGIINDDSNDVGKVHIGFALLLRGDSPDIAIKSELKHGALASLEECKLQEPHLETWSQFVLKQLEETCISSPQPPKEPYLSMKA